MGDEVCIALVHVSRPLGAREKTGNLTRGSIAIICPASHEDSPCQVRQDSPNSHPKVAAKIGNSVSIAAKRSIKGSRRVLSEFEPAGGLRAQAAELYRSSSLQDTKRDGCLAHVTKTPRSGRNVLAHTRPAAQEIPEFIVAAAISLG